jgi:hypothetical protein
VCDEVLPDFGKGLILTQILMSVSQAHFAKIRFISIYIEVIKLSSITCKGRVIPVQAMEALTVARG